MMTDRDDMMKHKRARSCPDVDRDRLGFESKSIYKLTGIERNGGAGGTLDG